MHRFLLLVTILGSLAAATGCGARAARHSATPVSPAVAEASTSDPSWCPPGEEFSFEGDARDVAQKEEAMTEIKPNTAKRPTRGAVHAAVY